MLAQVDCAGRKYYSIIPQIEAVVAHCNAIVIGTYQFIRLFCLKKYAWGAALPKLDEKFILSFIKAKGKRDNRGRKAQNESLHAKLDAFYISEFKPLFAYEDKFELRNYVCTTLLCRTDAHRNLQNLKEHLTLALHQQDDRH